MTDEHETNAPDDPRFDEWLRALASDVNAPPATPRDTMWAEITARRAAARTAQPIRPIASAASRSGRWLWPAAVAAALVLGVGLERTLLSSRQADSDHPRIAAATDSAAAATPTATSPHDAAAIGRDTPGSTIAESGTPRPRPASAASERMAAGDRSTARPGGATSERSADAVARVPRVAVRSDGAQRPRPASPVGERAPIDPSALYQLAAVQTLAQAEILLTTWRSRDDAAADSASLTRLGTWSRDVLGSTRLLLDSPAAEDPQLRRLLGDLELVLVQLVQLTGGTLTDEDRQLIDRALGERDLLPRLRTAVPAGTRTTAS